MPAYEAFSRGKVQRRTLRDAYGQNAECVANPVFVQLSAKVLMELQQPHVHGVVLRPTGDLNDRFRAEQAKAAAARELPPSAPAAIAPVAQGVSAMGTRHLSCHLTTDISKRQLIAGMPGSKEFGGREPGRQTSAQQGKGKVIDFSARKLCPPKREYVEQLTGGLQTAAQPVCPFSDESARAQPGHLPEPQRYASDHGAPPVEASSSPRLRASGSRSRRSKADGKMQPSDATAGGLVEVFDCIRVDGEDIGRLAHNKDSVCCVAAFEPLGHKHIYNVDVQSIMFLHPNPIDQDGGAAKQKSHAQTNFFQLTKQFMAVPFGILTGMRDSLRQPEDRSPLMQQLEEAEEAALFWMGNERDSMIDIPLVAEP